MSEVPRHWRGQPWRYGLRLIIQTEENGDVVALSGAPVGAIDHALGEVSINNAIRSMELAQGLFDSPEISVREAGTQLAPHLFRQLIGAK